MSDYTLHCGDCLEVMAGMEAGSVDAIITDPPYGIGADKTKAHSSIRDNSGWAAMNWDSQRPDSRIFALLLQQKYVAIWGGNYFSDILPASPHWLIWVKPEAETGFSLADAELCWTNGNGAVRVKTMNRRDGNLHPTQKPVALMEWTMEQLRIPVGATILDPFMGSGTTGVAAMLTGRKFIGIELDENYFKIAEARISKASQMANGEFVTKAGSVADTDDLPLFAT